nr:cytidylate kinase family protein [uncultured Holdemanella sp.]
MDEYKVPAKQAKKILQEKDTQRSRFYEFYTNQKWGNPHNYTLMVNTSKMSTDDVVRLLASFYDAKKCILTFKNAFENQYEKNNKY